MAALAGCQSGGTAPKEAEKPKEPVSVEGKEEALFDLRVNSTISSEKEKLTMILPVGWQGTSTLPGEAEPFIEKLRKVSPDLAGNVTSLVDALRAKNGVMIGFDMRPQEAKEGFAANLSLSARTAGGDVTVAKRIEALKEENARLEGLQTKQSVFDSAYFGKVPVAEFSGKAPGGQTSIDVVEWVYFIPQSGKLYELRVQALKSKMSDLRPLIDETVNSMLWK